MDVAGEHITFRVKCWLMREDKGRLNQRTGVPAHELLPNLRWFPPVVVSNHNVDDQAPMGLAPESKGMQKAIAGLRHTVQKITQHNEPGAIVRSHEICQPLQIGNGGAARHRDSSTPENIVLAEMRVCDH
jgi:hypothetical protein